MQSKHGNNNRGSALVLAMIVTLALTAIGIATVNSVMETATMTGAYRVQSQAVALTESATTYMGAQASRSPRAYIKAMQQKLEDQLATASGSTAEELKNRGGFIRYDSKNNPKIIPNPLLSYGSSNFRGSGKASFQAQQASKVRVIVRDPVTVRAPGYGDEYCFKKVTVASESTLGDCTSDADYICGSFDSRQPVATKQSYMEALLGPIKCTDD